MEALLKHFLSVPYLNHIMEILGEARLIGGCVRDAIIGKELSDIDIAVPNLPNEVISKLEKRGVRAIPTGIKFGTITAVIEGKPFEITTLRKDVECDGRHAVVEFTDDWELDASRRDFTINALSYSLKEQKLYDYFGGIDDLNKGIVKFIGLPYKRIKEDYLRILRFFRFSAFYANELDQQSLGACISHAKSLKNLSGERVQTELLKLLTSKKCYEVLKVMDESNILLHLEISSTYTIKKLKHLLAIEERLNLSPNPLLRLASIILLDKDNIKLTVSRLRLSNKSKDFLLELCNLQTFFPNEEEIKNIIFKKGEEIAEAYLLLKWSENPSIDFIDLYQICKRFKAPIFPVKANDLMQLGLNPGRELGDALKELTILWQKSGFSLTKEELLKLLK
jgi:poly(A) polymerase